MSFHTNDDKKKKKKEICDFAVYTVPVDGARASAGMMKTKFQDLVSCNHKTSTSRIHHMIHVYIHSYDRMILMMFMGILIYK